MPGPDDTLVLKKQFPAVGLPPFTNAWLRDHTGDGTFPDAAVTLGSRLKAWWLSDIKKFLANLPPAGHPLPKLWSPQPRPPVPMAPAMLIGRRPGGKMVTDPVTGKRRYVVPERRLITRPTRRDPPDDPPFSEAAQ